MANSTLRPLRRVSRARSNASRRSDACRSSSHWPASQPDHLRVAGLLDLMHLRRRRLREAAHDRHDRDRSRAPPPVPARRMASTPARRARRARARARPSPRRAGAALRASTAPTPAARRSWPSAASTTIARAPPFSASRMRRASRAGSSRLGTSNAGRNAAAVEHAHQVAECPGRHRALSVNAHLAAGKRAALLRKRGRHHGAGELRHGAQRGIQFRADVAPQGGVDLLVDELMGRGRCARSVRKPVSSSLLPRRSSKVRLSVSTAMRDAAFADPRYSRHRPRHGDEGRRAVGCAGQVVGHDAEGVKGECHSGSAGACRL